MVQTAVLRHCLQNEGSTALIQQPTCRIWDIPVQPLAFPTGDLKATAAVSGKEDPARHDKAAMLCQALLLELSSWS